MITNAKITSISLGRGGKAQSINLSAAQPFSIPCDLLVSTVPITELGSYLMQSIERFKQLSTQLGFRDIILVNVFLKKERFSPAHWIYLVDGRFNFHRISEQKNLSVTCCPEGRTMITMEISGNAQSGMWEWPDSEFYSLVHEDLKFFNVQPEQIEGLQVSRLPCAYPIYFRDYEKRLKETLLELSAIGNLVSTGRQGLFMDIDMHDAMLLGKLGFEALAAQRVAEFYQNFESWLKIRYIPS